MNLDNEKLVELIQNNIYPIEHLESLYIQNKSLMVVIIQRTLGGGASSELIDELLQECYIILCNCVKSFDVNKGFKFSTYFSNAIKWGIYKYTLSCGAKIRVPGYMVSKVYRYKMLINTGVSERDILRALRVSRAELDIIKQVGAITSVSLDTPIKSEGENNIFVGDVVADDRSNFENDVINKADESILYNLCKSILTAEEFQIIKYRCWWGLSFESIASKIGVSYGRIRTIKFNALRKLRGSNKIKAYYEPYLHRHTGVEEFNRTHTSSVERYVIKKIEADNIIDGLI